MIKYRLFFFHLRLHFLGEPETKLKVTAGGWSCSRLPNVFRALAEHRISGPFGMDKVSLGAQEPETFETRGVCAYTDVCLLSMFGGKTLKQIQLFKIGATVQDQMSLFSQQKL